MVTSVFQMLLQLNLMYTLYLGLMLNKTGSTNWLANLCYSFIVIGSFGSITVNTSTKVCCIVDCLNESYRIMVEMNIYYEKFRLTSLISLMIFCMLMLIKFYVGVVYSKVFNSSLFFTMNFGMVIINCFQSLALTMTYVAESAFNRVNEKLIEFEGCVVSPNVLIYLMKIHWRIGNFIEIVNKSFGTQLLICIISLLFYSFSVLYTFIHIIVYDIKNPLYPFWVVSNVCNFIWASEVIARLSYRSHRVSQSVSTVNWLFYYLKDIFI